MGLAERKAIATVKETDYKSFEVKVNELCGFEVKMNFDWAVIESHKDCVWICESQKYKGYMFDPITDALKKVVSDNMGKEAVKASLKEIVMIPKSGDSDFINGVLTVRNDVTGNGAWGADSIKCKISSD